MEHLFFDSIDEMRNQTGSHGPNYLRNHTAERDYFSPLSIVTSIQEMHPGVSVFQLYGCMVLLRSHPEQTRILS